MLLPARRAGPHSARCYSGARIRPPSRAAGLAARAATRWPRAEPHSPGKVGSRRARRRAAARTAKGGWLPLRTRARTCWRRDRAELPPRWSNRKAEAERHRRLWHLGCRKHQALPRRPERQRLCEAVCGYTTLPILYQYSTNTLPRPSGHFVPPCCGAAPFATVRATGRTPRSANSASTTSRPG